MSSTSRGAIRAEHDHYRTNQKDIEQFLVTWMKHDCEAKSLLTDPSTRILDPCAGGNTVAVDWEYKPAKGDKPAEVMRIEPGPMPYPTVLRRMGLSNIDTIDIRTDSPANWRGSFLHYDSYACGWPEIVIGNPPFSLAVEFIQHALSVVRPGGYVVMLVRLNFFGSTKRKKFFDRHMAVAHYIHHERLSFTPDGHTDSIEYCHMVWQQGVNPEFSKGYLI